MSEKFNQQGADFLDMWIGGIPKKTQFFNLSNVAALQEAHGIPDEFSSVLPLVLETAALAYWKETDRAGIDYSARRKDLAKLEKASTRLASVLNELSPETWRILHEASVTRGFRHHSIRDIVSTAVQSVMQPEPDSAETPNSELNDGFDPVVLRTGLLDLAAHAQNAQKWAGAGKPGRPDDDSATDLMQACFLVWTEMAGREFTLSWHGNDPDSDAARLCVDVAGIVDPKLSPSRIITASRKVRETGLGINGLGKLIADAEEFCKRLE